MFKIKKINILNSAIKTIRIEIHIANHNFLLFKRTFLRNDVQPQYWSFRWRLWWKIIFITISIYSKIRECIEIIKGKSYDLSQFVFGYYFDNSTKGDPKSDERIYKPHPTFKEVMEKEKGKQ